MIELRTTIMDGRDCCYLVICCDGNEGACQHTYQTECGDRERRKARYGARAVGWVSTRVGTSRCLVDLCPSHH